jgi:hypothetical protein
VVITMPLALDDTQIGQLFAAAQLLPVNTRDQFLRSVANCLVPEQDRAAAQSTPAEDLGLRNPCR